MATLVYVIYRFKREHGLGLVNTGGDTNNLFGSANACLHSITTITGLDFSRLCIRETTCLPT